MKKQQSTTYTGVVFDLSSDDSLKISKIEGRVNVKDLPITYDIFAVKFFSNGSTQIRRVTKKDEKTVMIDKTEFPENLWNFIEIYPIKKENIEKVLIQGREKLTIFLESAKKEPWYQKYKDMLDSP